MGFDRLKLQFPEEIQRLFGAAHLQLGASQQGAQESQMELNLALLETAEARFHLVGAAPDFTLSRSNPPGQEATKESRPSHVGFGGQSDSGLSLSIGARIVTGHNREVGCYHMPDRQTEWVAELVAEADGLRAEILSTFSQTGLPKSDCAVAAGANAGVMSTIHRPVVAMPLQIV